MLKVIDPKYSIGVANGDFCVPPLEICIVKTRTMEPIPNGEPLILFRARDKFALDLLRAYRVMCIADHCTPEHMSGIENRILAFQQFMEEQPERMKQPGCTRGL